MTDDPEEEEMRPKRSWWVIGLAAALAWGGAWCLTARRPAIPGRPTASRDPILAIPAPAATRTGAGEARGAPAERFPGEATPSEDDALAALGRGEQAREDGRLAEAERAFLAAAAGPGPEAAQARRRLAEVLWLEGRLDEVRALAEAIWDEASRPDAPDPGEAPAMLRFCLALGLNPLPVERIRADLDQAAGRAPDDDRVWLGRAHLSLREGRLDDAADRLDACLGRRPDDPAVWRARLDWATAAGRPAEAREALAHLRADDLPPGRVLGLRAWFAARRGDAEAERLALTRAVEAEPGDLAALERLIELGVRAGRPEEAARLRDRKAELDRALHRYRGLFRDGDPARDAVEMAGLAEALGRRFEAIALLTLALRLDPGKEECRSALDRLARDEPARESGGDTLAALLAEETGPAPTPGPIAPDRRPSPQFRDDATAAGLHFRYDNGESPAHPLPEVMGGGVALLDYDGDGWLDVYAVQGGPFPPEPAGVPMGDRLFRNRGDGTFEDATETAGLAAMAGGYGHGVAVGDIDNDGHPDLFITRWRAYTLYRNRGDGTFEEATETAGLGGDRDWPTSAAFADLDGDGDLDLYVCHYLAWDADHPEVCRSPNSGRVISCDPRRFAARPDHLFLNDGGRFVEVTDEAGIVDRDGRGLGVVAADLDEDGRVDLFVANDGSANLLFRNLGDLRFEEVGQEVGVAAGADGGYRAGMGVACGDLDGDGRPDLAVTNFFGESTAWYQNLGGGLFADRAAAIGLAAPSRYRLGFGIAFLDADADGRLDLLTVNGHVADERPEVRYAMPAQLLLGRPGGGLIDVTEASGPPLRATRLGRGLAVGDVDNDGRVDAILLAHGEPLAYAHNRGPGGRSVTILLEGTASNRDAIGARVALEADGRRQVAWRLGGGSYQSAGEPRLHFGLGRSTRAEAVEVRWPSGRVDRYRDLAAGMGYRLREGDREPLPLPGWGPSRPEPGSETAPRRGGTGGEGARAE